MKRVVGIFWLFVFNTWHLGAQQGDPMVSAKNQLTDKYTDVVGRKAGKVSCEIDKQTEKYLARLEKQEEKLKKEVSIVAAII